MPIGIPILCRKHLHDRYVLLSSPGGGGGDPMMMKW